MSFTGFPLKVTGISRMLGDAQKESLRRILRIEIGFSRRWFCSHFFGRLKNGDENPITTSQRNEKRPPDEDE